MSFRRAIVSYFLKTVISSLAKVECSEFTQALKNNKPMLVIFNHVNFLEVPILTAFSYPTYVTGLAKTETWDNPFFAFLFSTYKAVPIDRNGSFSDAFRKIKNRINNGYHVCIAPEGTRSKTGVLGEGKGGIIQIALETNVPILPVAHYGGENIWKNIKQFKRTKFYFKAGKPFTINVDTRPGKKQREEILAEIMGQMARLLPLEKRGIYTEQAEKDSKYLEFIT